MRIKAYVGRISSDSSASRLRRSAVDSGDGASDMGDRILASGTEMEWSIGRPHPHACVRDCLETTRAVVRLMIEKGYRGLLLCCRSDEATSLARASRRTYLL